MNNVKHEISLAFLLYNLSFYSVMDQREIQVNKTILSLGEQRQ